MPTWSGTSSEWGYWSDSSGNWEGSAFAGLRVEYAIRNQGRTGGVRFTGVDVPDVATVTGATLTITNSYSTAPVWVALANVDNAPALASNQHTSLARTSPAVQATVLSGSSLEVTGLGPQVASVMSRSGWSQGSALTLLLTATSIAENMQTRRGPSVTVSLAIDYDLPYDAGADQTVDPWELVTLTGTPAGGTWSQVSGESVSLGGSGATRTFTAPAKMSSHQMVFQYGTDPMTVTVNPPRVGIVQTGGAILPARFVVQ